MAHRCPFTNSSACLSPLSKGKILQLPPSRHPQIDCLVRKIPAATSLGFPGLACWASASPRAGLLCRSSCTPGVSSTCVGVCAARRAPPSPALLLLGEDEAPEELSGQPVTWVGDVDGLDVTVQTTNQPFPGKRCSESLFSSHFSWLTGWAAAALPRCSFYPGTGWHQDGSRMADPGLRTPTPVPSLAWDRRDTATALSRLKPSPTARDNCGPRGLIRSRRAWAAPCGAFRS